MAVGTWNKSTILFFIYLTLFFPPLILDVQVLQ